MHHWLCVVTVGTLKPVDCKVQKKLNDLTDEERNIVAHFKEPLSYHGFLLDLALKEWGILKKLVSAKFAHFSNKIDMWQRVYTHYNWVFPHVILIIELIKQGFSVMG